MWKLFFAALMSMESGGDCNAVGDGGRSIGPYQISRAYWIDSGVPGRWKDVRDPKYAERVMRAYWRRYCPRAVESRDWRTMARVHNGGGPRGPKIQATRGYWIGVSRSMNH